MRLRGVLGSLFNPRRQLIGYQLLIQGFDDVTILDPSPADAFDLPATPIANLLRYSAHQRYGHRVKVAGTVTLVAPDHIYIQDATSGVNISGVLGSPRLGDLVEAVGYPTLVGRYSPVLSDAAVRTTGVGSALTIRNTSADAILRGGFDSMLVSIDGRLRTVVHEADRTVLLLQSGVHTFTAQLLNSDSGQAFGDLREGSVVRLTGVCSTPVNPDKLYLLIEGDPTSFDILLRSQQDVSVLRQAPFWTAKTTLGLLAICALVLPPVVVWVIVLRRRVHVQNAALAKAEETAQAIRDLSQSMRTVTRDKRFDRRVSVRGSSDIARLVVGFNSMLRRTAAARERQAGSGGQAAAYGHGR